MPSDALTTALLQGLGLGLAIAAPVGPIGLLCIRRTLHEGASIGLATGLGAALADGMYGLLVVSGLALTGWLVRHALLLNGVGALLLIAMGLASLRALARQGRGGMGDLPDAAAAVPAPSHRVAVASTFLLTAANPSTIMSFVAVVGAWGAGAGSSNAAYALVFGVFLGSMLWWVLLVTLLRGVGRLASRAWLRAVHVATGVLLLASGLWVGARVGQQMLPA